MVDIGEFSVRAGVVERDDPAFEQTGRHSHSVLVRVRAASLNYRDMAIIAGVAGPESPLSQPFIVGSELCGIIEGVGADVEGLQEGDRVVADGTWGEGPRASGGLPTNSASSEYLILAANKVHRVPEAMETVEAAAFAVGGQTSASMFRRCGATGGDPLLVTAGRSNTSLFLIQVAAAAGSDVTVATTSVGFEARLIDLGAARVATVDRSQLGDEKTPEPLLDAAKEVGGFAAVLDPFGDVWMSRVVQLMRFGATYVTCGLRADPRPPLQGKDLFTVVMRNQCLLGNCLGLRSDMATAFELWEAGDLAVPLWNSLDHDVEAFLNDSFTTPERFGKTVWEWS